MEYQPGNVAPRILSRAEHIISRKNIDPDALKVLYRLRNNGFVAYLVGGGVRDLLLERQPKDFDISTSAHPAQVKKLFRNCFVVGRRFRLCHVRFGRKVIEVSTFRSQAEPEEGDTLIRRDNTFGTPEQDAFRRDFTVNALFYDIATFSVIDWVGGLADLRQRVISAIGDPGVRLREDPVRMLRAVALAARLGFTIDRDCEEAIRALRGEIVRSSPARILEEIYKILRQGARARPSSSCTATAFWPTCCPRPTAPLEGEARPPAREPGPPRRLSRRGRRRVEALTNALLLGTLLVPLGVPLRRVPGVRGAAPSRGGARPKAEPRRRGGRGRGARRGRSRRREPRPRPPPASSPFALPFPRRDLDRLRVILLAQRRLPEIRTSPAVKHVLGGAAVSRRGPALAGDPRGPGRGRAGRPLAGPGSLRRGARARGAPWPSGARPAAGGLRPRPSNGAARSPAPPSPSPRPTPSRAHAHSPGLERPWSQCRSESRRLCAA